MGDGLEEIIDQQRDVLGAFAQRRQTDPHDVEPVKQILAKLPGGDRLFEPLVRRGNDANIHRDRIIAADALDGAVLQHTQNLGLRRQRHVADLVEEQRALVALLKLADALRAGPGERALFVAEQLALEQALRDRCAVDRQIRFIVALAVLVNGASNQFLAGAALAGDQRRGIRAGQLADHLEHLLHRLAAADNAQVVILRLEQRLARDNLFHVASRLECVGDDLLELGHVKRLEQIVVRAEFHRLDRGLRRAKGGHHDHRQLSVVLPDAPQRLQPGDAAHANVHQHEIRLKTFDNLKPLLAAGGGFEVEIGRFKNALERVAHIILVIDEQKFVHCHVPSQACAA